LKKRAFSRKIPSLLQPDPLTKPSKLVCCLVSGKGEDLLGQLEVMGKLVLPALQLPKRYASTRLFSSGWQRQKLEEPRASARQ